MIALTGGTAFVKFYQKIRNTRTRCEICSKTPGDTIGV